MKPALAPALSWLLAACATLPVPKGPPHADAPKGRELDVCVLWGERTDRPQVLGVSELSFAPWHQAIASIVIHRGTGDVIVDPAFGVAVAEDLSHLPPWFRVIAGEAKTKTPTVPAYVAAGGDVRDVHDVLLTHAHWDHAGALRDLPFARVRLSSAELDFVAPLRRYLDAGVMPHHFEGVLERARPFTFDGPPILRFEASHDVFGDGSVIAVPLPGHTPGSTGYLVHGRGGRRWLLVGDTAWSMRGIELPAHKMVRMLDSDGAQIADSLGRLHALMIDHPDIVIVPAHDAAALETMPTCKGL